MPGAETSLALYRAAALPHTDPMTALDDAPVLDKTGLIGGCLRLPVTVDAGRLRREVEGLADEIWDSPGDRVGVHRAAGAVFLRGYAPAEGDKPIQDRPVLDALPYCRDLIERLEAPPLRCLLARLPGGALIPTHSDLGPYFARTLRIHFPVISHARAWMMCDGLTYLMAPGEAWVLNNALPHAVWNAHPSQARTHLICDYLLSPALQDLFSRGERNLGRRVEHVEQEITARTARRAVRA